MDRIKELISKPRMFYAKPNYFNTCEGLLDLITKYIRPDFVMAEIGSFSGVSTELFALHCKTVYSVDEYMAYHDINKAQLVQAEQMFVDMQKRCENITKIKKNSMTAVNDFEDGFFDLVYIDASHRYEDVKADISSWMPKVKNGGYLAGHDINLEGVAKAVSELLSSGSTAAVESFNDTSWIYTVCHLP